MLKIGYRSIINKIKLLPEKGFFKYFSFEQSEFVDHEIDYATMKKKGQEIMNVLNKATKRRSEYGNKPASNNDQSSKVIVANYRGKKIAGMRPVSFDEVGFLN